MGKVLSDSQIAQYEDQGYLAPIPVLTREQAGWYREQVERFLEDTGGADPRAAVLRTKVHLRCPALLELVFMPTIVDAIADLLGPDLLCRSSSVFLKVPGDAAYVAWHQDAAYRTGSPVDLGRADGRRRRTGAPGGAGQSPCALMPRGAW
jgi:hypothetical protein